MFPGKGKFEFGYDLLHHSAYCIDSTRRATRVLLREGLKNGKIYDVILMMYFR